LSALSDRIRGIVAGGSAAGVRGSDVTHPTLPIPVVPQPPPPNSQSLRLEPLGGAWRDACYVVEREWAPSALHGRDRIGTLASTLHAAADAAAPLFTGGSCARVPLVFFDLETTGLSGGAGTHAFLVGCGWFDDDRFVTRQFVMTRFADERPMLETVAREIGRAGALVSFNGKSFDAPVLETRYLFHRLQWIGGELPHLDVLHPARQFWKRDECSLVALERQLIGHRRTGDVAGFEIPARYFQYVRSGDAGPLAPVLRHNRLDLLSLAALTARLLDLARRGPGAARDTREAAALGRVYARAGLDERAYEAYRHALAICRAPAVVFDAGRLDALRSLALTCRRLRRFGEAAVHWEAMLAVRGCPEAMAAEAAEALAIHHEHRIRDLETARTFALRTLETVARDDRPSRTDAVRHRLGRLERKLKQEESLKNEVRSLEF
jgi:uncharacterized protein YprB with RNaseH-like and TPR domain